MSNDIKLPQMPEWAKQDDLGELTPSEVRVALSKYARAAVLADREARGADAQAKLDALKKHVCDPRHIGYADKVVHPCNGPSYQNWTAELWMPDPLPDPYDRRDLDTPRLTPEQAFDRFMELLAK